MNRLPPRPPPPPSYMGDDPITAEENVELFKIHHHPPEGDISREGLESYLKSLRNNQLNKSAIPCYYRPNLSKRNHPSNCRELLTAPLIRSIVSDEFYAEFMNQNIELDPRLSTVLSNIDATIISDTKTENQTFGEIYGCAFCPYCLQVTCRAEGCAYMKHPPNGMKDAPYCDMRLQNRDLFLKYRRAASRLIKERYGNEFPENKITLEFCIECGRPCVNHMHFDLPKHNKLPTLIPQAGAGICTGGGRKELFARILALRDFYRKSDHHDAVKERRDAALVADKAAGNAEWIADAEGVVRRINHGVLGEEVWGDPPIHPVRYASNKLNEVRNVPYDVNMNGVEVLEYDDEVVEFIQKFRTLMHDGKVGIFNNRDEVDTKVDRIVDQLEKDYPIEKLSDFYDSINCDQQLGRSYSGMCRIVTKNINNRVNATRINNFLNLDGFNFDPIITDRFIWNKILLGDNSLNTLEDSITKIMMVKGIPFDQEWIEDGVRRPFQMAFYRIQYAREHPQEFQRLMNDNQPTSQLLGIIYTAYRKTKLYMLDNMIPLSETNALLSLFVSQFIIIGPIFLTKLLSTIYAIIKFGNVLKNIDTITELESFERFMFAVRTNKDRSIWVYSDDDRKTPNPKIITDVLLLQLFNNRNSENIVSKMQSNGVSKTDLIKAANKIHAMVLHRGLDFLKEPLAIVYQKLGMRMGGKRKIGKTRKANKINKQSRRNYRR